MMLSDQYSSNNGEVDPMIIAARQLMDEWPRSHYKCLKGKFLYSVPAEETQHQNISDPIIIPIVDRKHSNAPQCHVEGTVSIKRSSSNGENKKSYAEMLRSHVDDGDDNVNQLTQKNAEYFRKMREVSH